MQIKVKITANGTIICRAEIDGRTYRSKFKGCNQGDARKRFLRHVKAAENKKMEELKQEIINICLTCSLPIEQCKGNCKIRQSNKIKRGKGVK